MFAILCAQTSCLVDFVSPLEWLRCNRLQHMSGPRAVGIPGSPGAQEGLTATASTAVATDNIVAFWKAALTAATRAKNLVQP